MASLDSESDDDFYSLCSVSSQTQHEAPPSLTIMEPPVHPVPCLQGPFEESFHEAGDQHEVAVLDQASTPQDRRQRVIDVECYDDAWTARWNQRPQAQHHPLTKLMAQIVFGLHLLQQEQAKSDEEVVKILQEHVNDIDVFLEHTAEDLDLAIADIRDRIEHMSRPLSRERIDVFDDMLQDTRFRTNLLTGKNKVEQVVDRTERAMNASMLDVSKGRESLKELATYLSQIRRKCPEGRTDVADIFDAMRGNEKGWSKYVVGIKAKKDVLGNELLTLRTVMDDIARLIADIDRHDNLPASPETQPKSDSSASPPDVRSKFSCNTSPSVTNDSAFDTPLARTPIIKPHPVPFETRYEQPRQGPPIPADRRSVSPISPPDSPTQAFPRRFSEQTPRHRHGESIAGKNGRHSSAQLRSSPALHSPGRRTNGNTLIQTRSPSREKRLGRSQTQGTAEVLYAATSGPPKHTMSFSVNQITPTMHTCEQLGGTVNLPTLHRHHSPPSPWRETVRTQRLGGKDHHTWTSGTAFARRISKRLRNERIPAHHNPFTASAPDVRPVDSAHSREPDVRLAFNDTPFLSATTHYRKPDLTTTAAAPTASTFASTASPSAPPLPQMLHSSSAPMPPPLPLTACIDFDPNNTDFGAPLSTLSPNVVAQINGLKARGPKGGSKIKAGSRTLSIRKIFHRGSIL